MRFCIRFAVAPLLSLCFATCDSSRTGLTSHDSSSERSAMVELKPINASLKLNGASPRNLIETKLNLKGELRHAQFVNAKNGWAGTKTTLFQTPDGGESWRDLTLNLGPESQVSSFFFVDEAHGWLSACQQAVKGQVFEWSSRILATNDAGKTWVEQAQFEGACINDIRFLNGSEGLATGARVVYEKPAYEEIFAIHTSDEGKNWNDVSEKVKAAIRDKYGKAADSGHKVLWSTKSGIVLLTRHGRLVASSNSGQSWRTLVWFKDVRPTGFVSSTGYYKVLDNPGGNLTVIAGAMGEEGYWGDLVVNEGADSWTSYELTGTPMLDAVFLSHNEVLACGTEIQPYDENTQNRKPPVGIILHSQDNGKSWSPVYRSKSNETFIYITQASDHNFYALSDAGTFVRFTLEN